MFHQLYWRSYGLYGTGIHWLSRDSAGYAGSWETGIYRHMGGQRVFLTKSMAAKILVNSSGSRMLNEIGIYGGSYGATLILPDGVYFTILSEGYFQSCVAASSICWLIGRIYNHGYTAQYSATLPEDDPISYALNRSIYLLKWLKGIFDGPPWHGGCTNVHFSGW